MADLKPCPFCGGEARLEHYYDTDGYLPMCSTDGCFGMIEKWFDTKEEAIKAWNKRQLPSAQPSLYGYNIEHFDLIARVLQKENIPPERVVEALTDIGRVVEIVHDEFTKALKEAVEQCVTSRTEPCGGE